MKTEADGDNRKTWLPMGDEEFEPEEHLRMRLLLAAVLPGPRRLGATSVALEFF